MVTSGASLLRVMGCKYLYSAQIDHYCVGISRDPEVVRGQICERVFSGSNHSIVAHLTERVAVIPPRRDVASSLTAGAAPASGHGDFWGFVEGHGLLLSVTDGNTPLPRGQFPGCGSLPEVTQSVPQGLDEARDAVAIGFSEGLWGQGDRPEMEAVPEKAEKPHVA